MQMQRWFGYRGSHLPFCRVFLFEDQLALFRSYHANDEALKQEILRRSDVSTPPDRVLVLAGERFVATAKVETRHLPLHPGPTPAIRIVEHENDALIQANTDLVVQFLTGHEVDVIEAPVGTVRGLITREPIGMFEVADLLDGLCYSYHDPDPTHEVYARWRSLEVQLGLGVSLLRTPGKKPSAPAVEPGGCPYSIAAYLRLWNALLGQHDVRGFYPTDRPGLSWHMIDIDAHRTTRPRFYVGVRFGSEGVAQDPRLAERGIQTMRRGLSIRPHVLETLWGTRGTEGQYYGDQLFDYHLHASQPVPRLHQDSLWRPRSHPGLVLVHLIRHPEKPVDMVALGLALPHGGPDHIAALRGATHP
jgi:hypothetical protein